MRRFWLVSLTCWIVLGGVGSIGANVWLAYTVDLSTNPIVEDYGPILTPGGARAETDETRGTLTWMPRRLHFGRSVRIIESLARRAPSPGVSIPSLAPGVRAQSLPWWMPFDRPTYDDTGSATWFREDALTTGWPMPSAWCTYRRDAGSGFPVNPAADTLRGGLELPGRPWAAGTPKVLPLRPRWLGLAVNWAFFTMLGVIAWLPIGGAMWMRQRRRRRLDWCRACGHPLAGAEACPECGVWARRNVAAG